jgi:hypothetical protein
LKYRVLCTQRIIISNASQFALGPQDISGFNEYPAAVSNTITVKNTSDGVAADLLNYAPKTVNAAVMAPNSSSTGSTQTNSIQHSSGSSYPSGEPHLPFLMEPLSLVLMDDLKVAHKYGGDDGA